MIKPWHKIAGAVAGATLFAGTLVVAQPHHVGPAYLYPDATLTPGVVVTQDIGQLTATNPTYSQAHRNTTQAQKTQICGEYPANCKVIHEIDHFCPLALGCADDVKNLWAQPASSTWNGQDYGFHAKDKLETQLVLKMKAGAISPKDAQNCILNDWVACYQKYVVVKPQYGAVDNGTDPDDDGVQ